MTAIGTQIYPTISHEDYETLNNEIGDRMIDGQMCGVKTVRFNDHTNTITIACRSTVKFSTLAEINSIIDAQKLNQYCIYIEVDPIIK